MFRMGYGMGYGMGRLDSSRFLIPPFPIFLPLLLPATVLVNKEVV